MNQRVEDEFAEIATETIEQAQGVECSVAEYLEGIELVIERLQANLEKSRGKT